MSELRLLGYIRYMMKKKEKLKIKKKNPQLQSIIEKIPRLIIGKRTHWQWEDQCDSKPTKIHNISHTHIDSFVVDDMVAILAQSAQIYRFMMQRNNQLSDQLLICVKDLFQKRLNDVKKFVDIYKKYVDMNVPWKLVEYEYQCFNGRKRIDRYRVADKKINTVILLNKLDIRDCEKDWWTHGSETTKDPMHRIMETSYMQCFCDEDMNVYLAMISFVPMKEYDHIHSKTKLTKKCDPCDKCNESKYLKCGSFNLQCKDCKSTGTIHDWCTRCHGNITGGFIRQSIHENEEKTIDSLNLFERAMDPQSHTVIHFELIDSVNQITDPLDTLCITKVKR